jgi:hypothetical protein
MGSMNSTSLSRSSPAGLFRRGLLALLLVGALLLCYGAYGTLHKVSDIDLATVDHSSVEMGAMGEHSGGHPCGHLGSSECAAALLVVFLKAVIGLLAWGTWMRSRVAVSSLPKRRFPLVVLHPPRGPTYSLLQVFRL